MSHFTVMVIGGYAERQLARFSEHIEVPEYRRREVTEEDKAFMIESYEKKGLTYDSFDACYEAHGEDWNYSSWRKDDDGKWHEYTTWNPDGKWDWYELGGRWSGMLILKPGKKGVTGEPGDFGNTPGIDKAYKKDIDFERMYAEAREKAREHYREIAALFDGDIPKLTIQAPDRRMDIPAGSDYKALWEEYKNQESVQLFKEKVSGNGFGPDLDDYQCTEEEFINDKENAAVATFAYIRNGEWYGRGKMGWFGSVSRQTMTEREWHKHMREVVDALPDNTLISIYDCHC